MLFSYNQLFQMGCISPPLPQVRYPSPSNPNQHYQNQRTHSNFQPNSHPKKNTQIGYSTPSSVVLNPNSKVFNIEQTYDENGMLKRYGAYFRKNNEIYVDVRIPTTSEKTKFIISKQPLLILPVETGNYPINVIKCLCFQEKMTWMRIQVEKMRISWETGCEWLQVDRQDVLMSSLHGLRGLNLRKQLKIKLSGQEVDDAGGVLREWMHLCVKHIFSCEVAGLFKMCNTDETAYRFIVQKIAQESEDQYRMDVCSLLGIVIGKALFDRVPLDCYLTRSILRLICSQEVQQCDFYNYDSQIYKNLKVILETPDTEDLSLTFTYYVGEKSGQEEEVILKPNGQNITVNDSNKQEYVNLLINYLCSKNCQRYIKQIKDSINKVIPLEILSIFEPHEIEMLLNGPQNINVTDWRNSTQYIDYNPSDPVIIWFWTYVEKLDQQKLGNLLHFVTGSRRVPILGFSFLQSNRNKVNRFTIQRAAFQQHNPYPKGHTCFNRLQLPVYQSQAELNTRMSEILAKQINSFGMS